MRLTSQRRMAAQLLKCGETRIWFDSSRLDDIKQAITKSDIRHLINDSAIKKEPAISISGARHRKHLIQKRKGRRQGEGSRKGKRASRLPKNTAWIPTI